MEALKSKVEELLVNAAIDQARYMFCFNSIVKELEDKETKLKKARDGIETRIDDELRKCPDKVVDENVTEWLKDVDIELADVQKLKAEIDEKDSSLHGLRPKWCRRYWLGRKASQKTSKLSDLLQDCSQFNTVAFPKPLPLERELSLPSHFTSTFEATKWACNQIIEALKKDSTKMVGLHGLGGVGKTSLAKSVGSQLRQQKIFDKVGIATISQDPDIIKVQGELAKSLGWALNEKDEKERADGLHSMFSKSKSSKILIILDDVWKQLDLEKKLGIPVGDRDNCFKILLTTRKTSVCDSLGCDTQIPLSTLTPEEGLALLQKNARINVNDSTLNDVSKEVAEECKGLPLAIAVVGSALQGKRFNEWNLALHNLKAAKLYAIEGVDKDEKDVYRCLKFSYDNLNSEESKLCFLLCSLFPEDYEICLEDLVGYAVGVIWYQCDPSIEDARSLLHGTIDGLKAASLLLATGNDRSVKMHNIVRDVARWIGSEVLVEKKFFSTVGIELAERAMKEGAEKYRGISLVGNKKKELPSGLVCPNLHILRLENPEYDHRLQVPEHFFEGMPALKVVTIIGGVLSLKSLQILADNLQVLQLIRCDVRDAPFLGKLRVCQILYLKESPIEIPDGLEDELSRLKLLYIDTGSISPISPISIKKITQLEEFYGCINFCILIIEALKKDSTKMVGLHGLGLDGVGQTTLAKFLGNQLRQQKIFDEVGIVTVSQDPDIIKVQGELVKSLGWALNETDEKERADRLRLMFSESKSSKILVILDDVWKQLDLKTVGIPANCCKILLITPLQQVCDRMGCDTRIKLDALNPAEGLDLLRKHAGIDVADKTLTDVSKRVADECKGLPLAIIAVGSALRGRTADEWNLALYNLRKAKLDAIEGIDKDDHDVYGCLKFSYDYLNGEDSRSCFLLTLGRLPNLTNFWPAGYQIPFPSAFYRVVVRNCPKLRGNS